MAQKVIGTKLPSYCTTVRRVATARSLWAPGTQHTLHATSPSRTPHSRYTTLHFHIASLKNSFFARTWTRQRTLLHVCGDTIVILLICCPVLQSANQLISSEGNWETSFCIWQFFRPGMRWWLWERVDTSPGPTESKHCLKRTHHCKTGLATYV